MTDRRGIEAVILDLDGTLVDTLGDFVEALARMLDDLGLPPIEAGTVALMVGKGTEHLLRSVLGHVLAQAGRPGDAQALYPKAWARYHHHYAAINGRHASVYPGVQAGLVALRAAGLRMACVTNKPTVFAQALLRAKGLDGFFAQVFGGDAFERKKPDPQPLLEACRALGSAPARTLMVGDSSNDAQAAGAAGCPIILVTYGYNHGHPIDEVPAIAHVDRLDAVPWSRWLA